MDAIRNLRRARQQGNDAAIRAAAIALKEAVYAADQAWNIGLVEALR